jgi:hypothetical protein
VFGVAGTLSVSRRCWRTTRGTTLWTRWAGLLATMRCTGATWRLPSCCSASTVCDDSLVRHCAVRALARHANQDCGRLCTDEKLSASRAGAGAEGSGGLTTPRGAQLVSQIPGLTLNSGDAAVAEGLSQAFRHTRQPCRITMRKECCAESFQCQFCNSLLLSVR